MSGPQVSIVISPGAAAQRLGLSVKSAVAAGDACDAPFEIVVALADADAPTREVAEALAHPRLRGSAGSAASTRAAAELAWGETVVLMAGGDLLSPNYVARLTSAVSRAETDAVIARPAACLSYGGSPSIRLQESLRDDVSGRGRLMFGAPFAPPLAGARALLVRLPPRPWSIEADWAWTAETLAAGVAHEAIGDAAYVAWTSPLVPSVAFPPLADDDPGVAYPAWPDAEEVMASEAEVSTLLYARATQARMASLEAEARANGASLQTAKGDSERLEAALAAAIEEAEEARRSVAALQASISWKVTSPLRALASLIKRGAGP